MPTIDNLEIKVQTSAKQAAEELRELGSALASVKSSSGYPKSLDTYAKNLTTLASSLEKTDAKKLSDLARALSGLKGVGEVKLSPTIATNLSKINDVVSKMSDSKIERIERLANAIGKLRSTNGGGGVSIKFGDTQKSLGGMNDYLRTADSLTKKFRVSTQLLSNSWSAVLGIVASVRTALRTVVPLIKNWVNESNNYIENLNKFNVVMGQYAQSEYDYAQKVNEVMGIDPAQWMEYESTFMTLGTGFGVASDRAAIMSRQLTQLGYDISSFNNISIEDSMQRVQSAFAGELEPVRRLGYDLSQTRLQAYATELGITTLVSSMTQAEKSQLRYYALMNQITEAQHDMAITLNAPANQLRIFQNYVTLASRSLGNIFIPILNKVIPYALAAAKAVRVFADSIASLLGFTLPEFDNSLRGVSTAADDSGVLADNLGAGASAAKKMKDNLQKFDELNVLKSPNDGGSGSGLVNSLSNLDFDLPTYDFLEGAVEQNVDSIYKRLMDFFKLDGFNAEQAGRTLAQKFNSIIAGLDTYTPGKTLGEKFNNILKFAYSYFESFDSYEFGSLGAKFINGIVDEFDGANLGRAISAAIRSGLGTIRGFIETLNWNGIGYDVGRMLNSIDWYGIFVDVLNIGTQLVRAIGDMIEGAVLGSNSYDTGGAVDRMNLENIPDSVAWRIQHEMDAAGNSGGVGNALVENLATSINKTSRADLDKAIRDLIEEIGVTLIRVIVALGKSAGEKFWEGVSDTMFGGHLDEKGNWVLATEETDFSIARTAGSNAGVMPLTTANRQSQRAVEAYANDEETPERQTSREWGNNIAAFVGAAIPISNTPGLIMNGIDALKAGTRAVSDYGKTGVKSVRDLNKTFVTSNTTITKGFNLQRREMDSTYSNLDSNVTKMNSSLDRLGQKVSVDTVNKFAESKSSIGALVTQLSTDTGNAFDTMGVKVYTSIDSTSKAITTPLNSIKTQITSTYKDAGDSAVKSIGDMGDKMSGALDKVVNNSKDVVVGYKGVWDGLKSSVKDTSNTVIAGSESMANGVTDAFNGIIRNLKNFKVKIPDIGDNKDAGKEFNFDHLHTLDKISIPRLAKGGSVRNSTYANIGEAGREAVIPLDKDTLWADVFVDKVQSAQAPALAEQNALLRQEVELLRVIAAKEMSISSSDVYGAVRRENEDMVKRTGNNPLAI